MRQRTGQRPRRGQREHHDPGHREQQEHHPQTHPRGQPDRPGPVQPPRQQPAGHRDGETDPGEVGHAQRPPQRIPGQQRNDRPRRMPGQPASPRRLRRRLAGATPAGLSPGSARVMVSRSRWRGPGCLTDGPGAHRGHAGPPARARSRLGPREAGRTGTADRPAGGPRTWPGRRCRRAARGGTGRGRPTSARARLTRRRARRARTRTALCCPRGARGGWLPRRRSRDGRGWRRCGAVRGETAGPVPVKAQRGVAALVPVPRLAPGGLARLPPTAVRQVPGGRPGRHQPGPRRARRGRGVPGRLGAGPSGRSVRRFPARGIVRAPGQVLADRAAGIPGRLLMVRRVRVPGRVVRVPGRLG